METSGSISQAVGREIREKIDHRSLLLRFIENKFTLEDVSILNLWPNRVCRRPERVKVEACPLVPVHISV